MIAEIATALSVTKGLKDIGDRIKDAEFKNLLAELQMALADIKVKCADLEEENLRLKGELKKAQQADDVRNNVEYKDGLYYLKEPMPGRPLGPYCPGCLDGKNKLQVLSLAARDFQVFGKYECPSCQHHYGGGSEALGAF